MLTQNGDIVDLDNFDACPKEHRQEFDQGIFYYTVAFDDLKNKPLSLGKTGDEYDEIIASRYANFSKDPNHQHTYVSFDTVSGLIYIVDAAERRLQKVGKTLHREIGLNIKHLEKIFIEAMYDLDIDVYVGRIKFENGKQRVTVASGFEQSQPDGRLLVFFDTANSTDESRFQFPHAMRWDTPDGSKPNDQPKVVKKWAHVHMAIIVLYPMTAGFIVIFICFAIFRTCITLGQNQGLKLTAVGLLGVLLIQIIVIVYPFSSRSSFCRIAPILASLGFYLILASIWTRFQTATILNKKRMMARTNTDNNSSNMLSTISKRKPKFVDIKVTKSQWITIFAVLLLIILLLILWFSIAGFPTVGIDVEENYDFNSDTITRVKYEHCTSKVGNETKAMGFFGTLVAILVCYLIALLAQSLSKQADKAFFNKSAIWASYCVVPSLIAVILLIGINLTMDVTYYVVVCIIHFASAGLLILAKMHCKKIEEQKQQQ